MRRFIALAGLLLVLGFVNWSVLEKERHLSNGRQVYLPLAPVDPRSLMQGDYMALRFRMANRIRDALRPGSGPAGRHRLENSDGYAVTRVDDRNIASFVRLDNGLPLADDEFLMRYRVRNGEVKFATNAFFFQEGHAQHYEAAEFGRFSVDDNGELLLIGMHDEDLRPLGPPAASGIATR